MDEVNENKGLKKKTLIKLLVISVVLFFIVFGSLRLYRLTKVQGDTYEYAGPTGNFVFDVVENDGIKQHILKVYTYEQDGKQHEKVIPLRYGPKEMNDINAEKDIDNKLLLDPSKEDTLRTQIYITQDPALIEASNRDSIVAGLEIMKVVGDYSFGIYKIPMKMAVLEKNDSNMTVVTCKDVTHSTGVILIKFGSNNRIYSEEDCIVIEATSNRDLIRVADRLVLDLLGVF